MAYMVVSSKWGYEDRNGVEYNPSVIRMNADGARKAMAEQFICELHDHPNAKHTLTPLGASIDLPEYRLVWDLVGITRIPVKEGPSKEDLEVVPAHPSAEGSRHAPTSI